VIGQGLRRRATAALAAAVPAQAASNSIWDWLFGPASCSCKWDV
jgi:hypothetical protein